MATAHRLTPRVLVGVDSGGTRTNVQIAVETESGETQTATYEVGESLSGALAPSLISEVLGRILAPLHVRLDELAAEGLPIHIWVSAAGYSPWTRDDFHAALQDIGTTVAGATLQSIGVANDAVSVLFGTRTSGVVIAGTGSNVIVKATDGTLHQAGGHEWVACDYGSGFWIGLAAIRQAYRDYEAGVDSVLLHRLREEYGLRAGDHRGLIAKLRDLGVADPNMKKEIARFTASVCAAAERGDATAQNLVKHGAEELADVTALILRRTYTIDELTAGLGLVQCGSVLGNALYRTSFEAQVKLRLRSGVDREVALSWQRVATGLDACINLARDLADSPTTYLRTDVAFRPAIVTM